MENIVQAMKTNELFGVQAEFLSNEIQPENFGRGHDNLGSDLADLESSA